VELLNFSNSHFIFNVEVSPFYESSFILNLQCRVEEFEWQLEVFEEMRKMREGFRSVVKRFLLLSSSKQQEKDKGRASVLENPLKTAGSVEIPSESSTPEPEGSHQLKSAVLQSNTKSLQSLQNFADESVESVENLGESYEGERLSAAPTLTTGLATISAENTNLRCGSGSPSIVLNAKCASFLWKTCKAIVQVQCAIFRKVHCIFSVQGCLCQVLQHFVKLWQKLLQSFFHVLQVWLKWIETLCSILLFWKV